MIQPRLLRLFLLLLLVAGLGSGGFTCLIALPPLRTIELAAGPDLEFRLREAFLTARPGDEIVLPEGTFEIRRGLSLDVSHVTLRGQGMGLSVLDFGGVDNAAQGLLVAADAFHAADFAIEDPAGDGLKVEGADGVRIERVRVEWTGGPSPDNGSYGLYPVSCHDVRIEGSLVIGASDAGIYVGQSSRIIVHGNEVRQNVAGIEIENSVDASVFGNVARENTGGILVFDLPGLSQAGRRTRVFLNTIEDNNTPNFAPPGNIVGQVPTGTGLMILATDEVYAFSNTITGNDTANVLIVSFLTTGIPVNDPGYDPYPETIEIRNNQLSGGGTNPAGIGELLAQLFAPDPVPDIFWDAIANPALVDDDGQLPPDLRLCIQDNPGASFGALGFPPSRDLAPHDCGHGLGTAFALQPFPERPPYEPSFSDEEIEALCSAPGPGVNWDAFAVSCPDLADYRLFPGGDPRVDPDGGILYDLTTPLFSDYASKYRFVFLPPGGSVVYNDTEPFAFPVGTVIAKTFAFRDDLRDPGSPERLVETRLLVHRPSGWVGIPYIWTQDQSEALLSLGGGLAELAFVGPDGVPRQTEYEIPDATQCGSCHLGGAPIGPRAGFLNRDFDYASGTENQLAHWSAVGALVGAPDPAAAPRYPFFDDPADGTLEERARAYLDINCAHCHSGAGRARFSGLLLEIDRPFGAATGLCKTPVAAGAGSGGLQFDIVPGAPAESIMLFRMQSVVPAIRMPEILKGLPHDEGVALISDWIASLPGSCD